MVSVVKMATALEDCTIGEQRPVVRILWEKGHDAKNIYKNDASCSRKCLSCKAVHSWVEKHGKIYVMTKRLKRMCGNGCDNRKKTSMLRVSTRW
jgi:hypothetical protein